MSYIYLTLLEESSVVRLFISPRTKVIYFLCALIETGAVGFPSGIYRLMTRSNFCVVHVNNRMMPEDDTNRKNGYFDKTTIHKVKLDPNLRLHFVLAGADDAG